MSDLRALIVDWGGVLTTPLGDAMLAWCVADGLDHVEFRKVMKEWLGTASGDPSLANPIHALERGEIAVPDFERELASRLRTVDGREVAATGLLERMFAKFEIVPEIGEACRRAKAAGLKTALLSNSWGNDYPREGWEEMFDVVVISGEVNMRKPEPQIYALAVERLGLAASQCVFVDDLAPNIRAAEDQGMVGVLHITPEQTLDELEALFSLPLRG